MELFIPMVSFHFYRSLEDDKYDHVTATYFLLAERVLKKRHGSGPFHVKLEESESYPYDDLKSARFAFCSFL